MGLASKRDIYHCFIKGASSGIKTVAEISPYTDWTDGCSGCTSGIRLSGIYWRTVWQVYGRFSTGIVQPFVVKIISSSAATGLALDIFKEYGMDSYAGLVTSLALSSTETVFYTMSVYYMAVG